MAEKCYSFSPYSYCLNNPINLIDPTGMVASPVYDEEGNLLGTDDQGLQGDAIVMKKDNFKQGMKHEDAKKEDLGTEGLKDDAALTKFAISYVSLPSRPDYDGFVTVSEGVEWAKSHPGALDHPTPENTLYLDASKLDFGNITTSDFYKTNTPVPINLLNPGNFTESCGNEKLRATVYALGRVNMILLSRVTRNVTIVNDNATDYDWNNGGGFLRNSLINLEKRRTGLDDSHGFKAYYYGVGKLNVPQKPFNPYFPKP